MPSPFGVDKSQKISCADFCSFVSSQISNALSTSQLGHFYWLDLDNDYVYASYANHYLFGTYLVHNFGGLSFFKEMMNNNFVNIESIDEALKSKKQR